MNYQEYYRMKNKGFTLIELVIVIIILGILSATAIPKFVNLSSDARIASLEGIAGALSSTSLLVQLKAKVENVTDGSIAIDGDSVAVDNGYISGHWENAWRYALNIGEEISYTEIDDTCTKNAICGVGFQSTADGLPSTLTLTGERGLVLLWLEGDTLSDLCFAYYYNPGVDDDGDISNESPSVGIVSDGC